MRRRVEVIWTVRDGFAVAVGGPDAAVIWSGQPCGCEVKEAVRIDGSNDAVVLSQQHSCPYRSNLVRCGSTGEVVWRAEYPRDDFGTKVGEGELPDNYVRVTLYDGYKLVAWSFSGYLCHLDVESGKLLGQQFVK